MALYPFNIIDWDEKPASIMRSTTRIIYTLQKASRPSQRAPNRYLARRALGRLRGEHMPSIRN